MYLYQLSILYKVMTIPIVQKARKDCFINLSTIGRGYNLLACHSNKDKPTKHCRQNEAQRNYTIQNKYLIQQTRQLSSLLVDHLQLPYHTTINYLSSCASRHLKLDRVFFRLIYFTSFNTLIGVSVLVFFCYIYYLYLYIVSSLMD